MGKSQLTDYIHYGELFEVYGQMLSIDRQEIMVDYFQYNMTLVEIAQEKNISRQAVLDSINKSCSKLDDFERKIKLLEKKIALQNSLNQIKTLAQKNQNEQIISKVDNILKEL